MNNRELYEELIINKPAELDKEYLALCRVCGKEKFCLKVKDKWLCKNCIGREDYESG